MAWSDQLTIVKKWEFAWKVTTNDSLLCWDESSPEGGRQCPVLSVCGLGTLGPRHSPGQEEHAPWHAVAPPVGDHPTGPDREARLQTSLRGTTRNLQTGPCWGGGTLQTWIWGRWPASPRRWSWSWSGRPSRTSLGKERRGQLAELPQDAFKEHQRHRWAPERKVNKVLCCNFHIDDPISSISIFPSKNLNHTG